MINILPDSMVIIRCYRLIEMLSFHCLNDGKHAINCKSQASGAPQRRDSGVYLLSAGATHETGWRDLTVYWGVTVLPLLKKGEWRCRWRNWSSTFQRSRI